MYINGFPRASAAANLVERSYASIVATRWPRAVPISADRQLTAASLSVQGSDITILERRPLFSMAPVDLSSTNERVQYAVLGNGEQFLLNVMADEQPHRNVTVVLNWPALLPGRSREP